jgi:endoglycosylceramidase
VKRVLVIAAVLATLTAPALTAPALPAPAHPVAATAARPTPLRGAGQWLVDDQGRVVILHGLNQVYKLPPYTPSHDGFGADDAAFLQRSGFDAMRVGVIWAAVEPRPGHYDDAYLDSIARTVRTLAAHGIYSLLDFHQDLYNEQFQGEGAPAWAVQDGGLPNPALGFPGNYFGNPAENHAWDAFWSDAPAPDGIGLQQHYAAAWQHVAQRFRSTPSVLGYELLNEPWPGTTWQPCIVPEVGCASFDATMTAFYQHVAHAIRTVDPQHMVWIEPNVISASADTNHVDTVHVAHVGWAFHDYCPTLAELQQNLLCPQLDDATINALKQYGTQHDLPTLMTEFGATSDTGNLSEMVGLADKYRLGWTEWAYTGNDKTSTSPDGQALVLDPSKPPTGANVVTATLYALAEPYPQLVAGMPVSYSFAGGVFDLSYRTARAVGPGRFPGGSVTTIAVPGIQFPNGYQVQVSGGRVVSARDARVLRIASAAGAARVQVTVTAS